MEDKNKNDFLYCSNCDNSIYIFDLYKKSLNRIIKLWNNIKRISNIHDIIKWSNKYIIIINYYNNCINVFDVEQNKIINSIKEVSDIHLLYIKKIIHPSYGESLLASLDDSTIKYFI